MVSTRAGAPSTPKAIPGPRKSTRKLQLEPIETPIVHSKPPNAFTERAEQTRPVRSRKRRRCSSPNRTEALTAVHSSGSCQTLRQSSSTNSRCSSTDQGGGRAEQRPSPQRGVGPNTEASGKQGPDHSSNGEIAPMPCHDFAIGSHENNYISRVNGEAKEAAATTTPASLQLRISSLPILDNLATQIMEIFKKHTLPDLLGISIGQEYQIGQTFKTLNNLFCQTKKVYADDRSFLPMLEIDLTDASQIRTIRNANIATFYSIIFSGQIVDFQALLDYFLDTIVSDTTGFNDEHSELLVELLTQACISDIEKAQEFRSEQLARYFCINLSSSRFDPGATWLNQTHLGREHTRRLNSRRNLLLQIMQSMNNVTILRQRYPWEAFLGLWHRYLPTSLEALKGHDNLQIAGSCAVKPSRIVQQEQPLQEIQQTQNQRFVALPLMGSSGPQGTNSPATSNDIIEKTARAAQFAIENHKHHFKTKPNYQTFSQELQDNQLLKRNESFEAPGRPIRFHFEYGLHPEVAVADTSYLNIGSFQERWPPGTNGERSLDCMYDDEDIIPNPTQSAPTRVLYERARLAATSKSALHTPRKASASGTTQRRPWTSEEEHALMAGLDRVKGPHWSQIHAMFGPSGNINRSLKDRSQVQMKDKARNLKLFFLKSNIEVPYHLQCVTGELRTRAPSRALRQQTREKGATDEDRAHVSGIMTLAGSSTPQKDAHQNDEFPQRRRLPSGEPTPSNAFSELGLAPDDNIDPSLGALSPFSGDHHAGNALHAGMPYHVPTPNMIMHNLDRCTKVAQE